MAKTVFMAYFCQFNGKRTLHKVLQRFGQISQSYKITKFWIQRKWRHTRECTKHFTPDFLCIFFVSFMEKEPSLKLYGVFDHFSQTYEVGKFWTNKLYLDIKDVYARMSIQNMLIVAYMKIFVIFVNAIF